MSDAKELSTNNAAILVEGNLLACGAGMSAQSRHDVKNAFHFATLVADKAFDAEKQSREWYDKFVDVMRDLGFTIPKRSFELETCAELSVTVGAVAIRAIGAAGNAMLGGTVLGDLAKMAFDKMTTIENDARILEHKRKNKARGMVGLAACTETAKGDVVMVVSCVQAAAPKLDDDVLGIQWTLDRSKYYSGIAVLTLNTFVYDKVRETVENKLGVRSIENVLQYDI
ncbi:hypothetical protein JET76_10300 [Pseudomonas putida]|uniref:Uncharacterized protein n=1 Tax=Pseudomonas putida TaxID=303 RepID=A0A7W2L591_PSEPU|nr:MULTISPECIES: hypothetical protein [Pseudomonas]MBA6118635.1 hypothetical protein [Pseudomonas putida]MBI6941729.1 hypothetical protein [Pseudomonas putida]MBI6957988.1 hypothetical protein [Pseudomonas putida]MCZ9639863.1 hypothetical protein [Pseudomonas putida]MEC4875577.1 hypothetical protein [Pseudomonas sp. NC26]